MVAPASLHRALGALARDLNDLRCILLRLSSGSRSGLRHGDLDILNERVGQSLNNNDGPKWSEETRTTCSDSEPKTSATASQASSDQASSIDDMLDLWKTDIPSWVAETPSDSLDDLGGDDDIPRWLPEASWSDEEWDEEAEV
mmetsp:Transcript_81041/g.235030  ORF Transcript_81041/g.235030 Transcript_81041/m.235030 type:complete len:143 (+) Transcript_81041:52-480(+)